MSSHDSNVPHDLTCRVFVDTRVNRLPAVGLSSLSKENGCCQKFSPCYPQFETTSYLKGSALECISRDCAGTRNSDVLWLVGYH